MSGWREACVRFAATHADAEGTLLLLDAFGPDREGSPTGDFDAFEDDAEAGAEARAAAVVDVLSAEVDADQARLFARRLQSIDVVLAALARDHDAARVLRVALHQRVDDILGAPGPRALRVRALVDFHASRAAVLRHYRHGATAPLAHLVRDAVWRRAAAGVHHALLEGNGPLGPVHANVLRVQGARLRCLDLRAHGGDLVAACRHHGAIAGISGGFFLYSEPDVAPWSRRGDPVGLLVDDGVVRAPPVFTRSALSQHRSGDVRITRIGLLGWTVEAGTGRWRIAAVNEPAEPGVVALNRAWGERAPGDGRERIAVVGERVVAEGRGAVDIPLAGVVLSGLGRIAPGTPVRWTPPTPLADVIAGGPTLVGPDALDLAAEQFAGTAPPRTFSQDETYDMNLLPRMAAGLDDDGVLVLVAVDGRDVDRAPGLTLRLTAELCRELGCVRAMNLDGGSSKRMVVAGRVVDLPSTELVSGGRGRERVRPVHSAVLVRVSR